MQTNIHAPKNIKVVEHNTPPPTMPNTPSSCPSGGSIFMNDKCVCPTGTTKKTMRLPMAPGNLSYCE